MGSKEFCGDICQHGALALFQSDMANQLFGFQPLYHNAEAVAFGIEVRDVYLVRVAGKNYFCAFSGPGDDGFHLVRSEVLGFIHDDVLVWQAASSDVGEGFQFDKTKIQIIGEGGSFFAKDFAIVFALFFVTMGEK